MWVRELLDGAIFIATFKRIIHMVGKVGFYLSMQVEINIGFKYQNRHYLANAMTI
jgi:hypothetical protein